MTFEIITKYSAKCRNCDRVVSTEPRLRCRVSKGTSYEVNRSLCMTCLIKMLSHTAEQWTLSEIANSDDVERLLRNLH